MDYSSQRMHIPTKILQPSLRQHGMHRVAGTNMNEAQSVEYSYKQQLQSGLRQHMQPGIQQATMQQPSSMPPSMQQPSSMTPSSIQQPSSMPPNMQPSSNLAPPNVQQQSNVSGPNMQQQQPSSSIPPPNMQHPSPMPSLGSSMQQPSSGTQQSIQDNRYASSSTVAQRSDYGSLYCAGGQPIHQVGSCHSGCAASSAPPGVMYGDPGGTAIHYTTPL